jgi:hypothetical protein
VVVGCRWTRKRAACGGAAQPPGSSSSGQPASPTGLGGGGKKKQRHLLKNKSNCTNKTRIDNELNWTGAAAAVEIVQKSTGMILFIDDDTGEGLWHVIQRDNNRQQQQQ